MESPTVPAQALSAVGERRAAGAASGTVAGATAGAAAAAPLAGLLTPAAPLVVIFVAAGAGAGAGLGSVVDEASRYLRYPDPISVPLVCQSVAPTPSELAAAPVGIAARGLSDSESAAMGLAGRGGVIVTRVAAGSRAAQAGLRERDIIVGCNGGEVSDTADLEAVIRTAGPNYALRFRIVREGQPIEITLPRRQAGP